jgi:hypothetical protein
MKKIIFRKCGNFCFNLLPVGALVCSPLDTMGLENGTSWVFSTKHAANMRFTEVDGW